MSRHGDRQLSNALHTIALTQVRMPGNRGRIYYDGKVAFHPTLGPFRRNHTRRNGYRHHGASRGVARGAVEGDAAVVSLMAPIGASAAQRAFGQAESVSAEGQSCWSSVFTGTVCFI
ncbi:hypothetical protein [Nocardia aurantiaca]|uniref:hypothetical protein n=1 Tax=Nocardia aurantiaca TaxID=2675850 RepID=UPI002E241929